jgi:hypothetical protein
MIRKVLQVRSLHDMVDPFLCPRILLLLHSPRLSSRGASTAAVSGRTNKSRAVVVTFHLTPYSQFKLNSNSQEWSVEWWRLFKVWNFPLTLPATVTKPVPHAPRPQPIRPGSNDPFHPSRRQTCILFKISNHLEKKRTATTTTRVVLTPVILVVTPVFAQAEVHSRIGFHSRFAEVCLRSEETCVLSPVQVGQ